MAENANWLKKSDLLSLKRSLHVNLSDVNSTLTMQNGDEDRLPKPQVKRKSMLMFRDRKMMTHVPSDKKTKPSIPGPTAGFKNRTLKMVEGRSSLLPKSGIARRSQMYNRPEPKIQSTPISMSTPCDVPRSILRTKNFKPKAVSAKKVIFDATATDDGVCALQESTIQDFTQFDFRKTAIVTKVDASTNTDEIQSVQSNETGKTNPMMMNILQEISNKLDILLSRNNDLNCNCRTPSLRVGVKAISQFMTHLDDIEEVSENVTPSFQETSDRAKTPSTITPEVPENSTPNVWTVEPSNEKCVNGNDDKIDTHLETNVGPIKENVESTTSSPINEDHVPQRRRSNRRQATNHVDSPQPAISKLRSFRKRAIPRYLDSFELSPKSKKNGKIPKLI